MATMSELSTDQLDAIEARAKVAHDEPDSIDCAYIVNNAPELVLALVAECRRLRAEVERANKALRFDAWDGGERAGG
jgi:hypothetical protein